MSGRLSKIVKTLSLIIAVVFVVFVVFPLTVYYFKENVHHPEAGARGSLQAIYSMQEGYKSRTGSYAETFDELQAPLGAFINRNHELDWREGYIFRFVKTEKGPTGLITAYTVLAIPNSGKGQCYRIDETGTMDWSSCP